jgi:hypothetical protein
MANIEKCPACNVELEIDDSVYDKPFNCPSCQVDVMIPRPAPKPLTRASVLGMTDKTPRPEPTPQKVVEPSVKRQEVVITDIDLSLWCAFKLIFVFGTVSALMAFVGWLIDNLIKGQ